MPISYNQGSKFVEDPGGAPTYNPYSERTLSTRTGFSGRTGTYNYPNVQQSAFTPNIYRQQTLPVAPIYRSTLSAFGKKLQATKAPILKPLFSNPIKYNPVPNYTSTLVNYPTQTGTRDWWNQ